MSEPREIAERIRMQLDAEAANGRARIGNNPSFEAVAEVQTRAMEGMAKTINALAALCHMNSANAGWWNDPATGEDLRSNPTYSPYVIATKLLLMISEVAEAMEGHRKGLNDDKLKDRPMIEVELADALIRICDLAGALGLDLGGAIAAKLDFNLTRPDHQVSNRRKPGGKLY